LCEFKFKILVLGSCKISSPSRATGTWYLRCLDEYGHGEGHWGEGTALTRDARFFGSEVPATQAPGASRPSVDYSV
jgi:hypothetical protein